MLEIVGISKKFKNVTALDNINLSFADKGLVAILGESGSGKSTLFNILTGIVKPDGGQVIFNGNTLNEDGKINSQNVFGIIFQDGNLFGGLTVKENLDICCKDTERQNRILKNLGIKKYLNSDVRKISGGESQRVAIARALLDESKILLADEPTGSLDEKNGENVMSILKELSLDKLVIFITHNNEFAEKYADRIIKIHNGTIQEDRQNFASVPPQKSDDDNMSAKLSTDKEETEKKQRNLSFSSLNKFCFNKLKHSFAKSITSIIVFSVLLALIAISAAFLMADCRAEYLKSLRQYDYSELYNDKDMSVFAQKLEGGDTTGLTRYYRFAWVDGMCDKIIVDDTLKDDEIKLGYFTAEAINYRTDTPKYVGDEIDYNGYSFTLKEIAEQTSDSDLININSAVYLNQKTAEKIILNSQIEVRLTHIPESVVVLCDDTLEEGECIIDFGLYYYLAQYNPFYIDLRMKTVEWEISNSGTRLYKKLYTIQSVDNEVEDISVLTLYVSPTDYEEIKVARMFYGYLLKSDDKATIEYWWDRGVDIYNEGFHTYLETQEEWAKAVPYLWLVLIVGIVFSALYMATLLNHVSATNIRELYILKTLRVGDRSIFSLLVLQSLHVLIFANVLTFVFNFIAKTLIAKSIAFLSLKVAASTAIVFFVSLAITLIVCAIKTKIMNKEFDINKIR